MNLSSLIAGATVADILFAPSNKQLSIKIYKDLVNPPLIFDIVGEENINYQNDITDYVVEDNSSMQDHIARRPTLYTVTAVVSELNNVPPYGLVALKEAADRLAAISQYAPKLTVSALRAYNKAEQLYRIGLNVIATAKALISPLPVLNKQQTFINKLNKLMQGRELLTVESPLYTMESCVIQTLRVSQNENDKNSCEFTMTFKPVVFATTQITLRLSPTIVGEVVDNGLVAV